MAALTATIAFNVSFANPMPALAEENGVIGNQDKTAVQKEKKEPKRFERKKEVKEEPVPQKYTSEYVNSLTYSEIKGTGLANRCYDVEGEGSVAIKAGYRLKDLCI